MNRKRNIFLLIFLILLLFSINYRFLDTKIVEFLDESDFGIVERVIDGDTIVVNNNTHVRLLGINTPEKGERYYQEAKDYLSEIILNKTVKLEYGTERYDKYERVLAYILIGESDINSEIVRNGLANLYIYNSDKYTKELKQAWSECIIKNKNLCEKSQTQCADCIELKELDIKKQEVILYNNCSFSCNLNKWTIKDEGRKKFIFNGFILNSKKEVKIIVGNKTNSNDMLYWNDEEYVWTSSGDTLFLRDEQGKLVLWRNY